MTCKGSVWEMSVFVEPKGRLFSRAGGASVIRPLLLSREKEIEDAGSHRLLTSIWAAPARCHADS